MANLVKSSVITLALCCLTLSGHAYAECIIPAAPIVPDGNVASEDELVAAQNAMKAFQDSLAEHRVCLATEEATFDEDTEGLVELKAALSDQYNASVDAEEKLADEFNAAVRSFKARQK
jgi:hypothetical protein